MNRTQAIESAQELAHRLDLGPKNAQVATTFCTDEKVKTFVELEAGGKDAVVHMMDANLYQCYTWSVRLFTPFKQREALLFFTPNGIPYGFKEQLSENDQRDNLSTQDAQKKAEAIASTTPWNIVLSAYTLVESSQDKTPLGRIDHTFVYERSHETIGEGTYRLNITVSGDHVTNLYHFVKVPESFLHRYQEMRSNNENIAYLGTLIMILLYGIGGCMFGLLYLVKKRLLIYSTALYWAVGIACGIGLTIINKLPLHWMSYTTSHSPTNFLLQIGILVLYNCIFLTFIFTLVFATAEGLTRAAFPEKIQLWRLFNPQVASSYTVLGYTVGGYLLVPLALAYVIAFYIFTTTYYGWWTPSSALFDPNILATYFPWIESVAISLQAGFLEECLFRAIPLAGATLLGQKYGNKQWWIVGAFILQAVVFGAVHANYPSQPAYARLIELTLFSFVFGGVYLRFGLLPSIIAHFGYDVFLFALPIFVSQASGAFAHKLIIVAISLTPLWITLIFRLQIGTWRTVSEQFLNKAWRPTVVPPTTFAHPMPPQPFTIRASLRSILLALGLFGITAWITTTRFISDSPSIAITRAQVIRKASQLLQEKNIDPSEWTALANPMIDFSQDAELNKQHRFIWQQERTQYKQLLGSYLTPPHWIVRFAKFEGPLNERAEEYIFAFHPNGSLLRSMHKLPEALALPTISRDEAITRALKTIEHQFNISPASLEEVSVQATKQPNRTDWIVTYKDSTPPTLSQGQARISVHIAGNEVIDSYRSIHVPEKWTRTEDNMLLLASIITKLCQLAIYVLLIFGSLITIRTWGTFQTPTSLLLLIGLIVIFMFELCNAYPVKVFSFITSQPFSDQLFRTFGITSILLLLRAALLAISISFVTALAQHSFFTRTGWSALLGISIGIFFAGFQSLLIALLPSMAPTWANYTPLQFISPLAVGINSLILNYITLTVLLLFGIIALQSASFVTRNKLWGSLFFLFLGFISSGIMFADNLPLFIANGCITGTTFSVLYYLLLRSTYTLIPLATASYLILGQLQEAYFNNYIHSFLIHGAASAIVIVIAWIWYTAINSHTKALSHQGEI